MVSMGSVLDQYVVLSWGPSCAAGDTDYDVYTGTLGNWYSHTLALCGSNGNTSVLSFAEGDVYFLVVPRNEGYEGSYGSDSAGAPIPQLSGACAVQNVAPTCP